MKKIRSFLIAHGRQLAIGTSLLGLIVGLLLYKLGSITGGLSINEVSAATMPVGWHGIAQQPLYLPLKLVRSIVFWLAQNHGYTLTRLPNAIFGGLTILSFAAVIKLWHGSRTALIATALFSMSAWTLHVSRLASYDVLYLWAIPTLLLIHAIMHRQSTNKWVFYGAMLLWGLLLYIPGIIWLLIATGYLQRKAIAAGWKRFGLWWQRALYVTAGLIWLPLLISSFGRPGNFRLWLGLPADLAAPSQLLKQLGGVLVHMFVRGPQYPEIWLGRAPLLDVFTLIVSLLGIYFYATHLNAFRSRLLAIFFGLSVLLVDLGGPVSLSLVVPILFIAASTGIAYLLHDWLRIFPVNPLARGLGLGLIFLAVGLSSVYNTRAYFIAWPHNPVTQATFYYRL